MSENEKVEKTENNENINEMKKNVKAKKTEKVEKSKKKGRKFVKALCKLFVVIIFLIGIIGVITIAKKNYIRNDIIDKTNLIINNNNVTDSLKADIYVDNGVVYVAMQDIRNFFDSTITYDEKYDQIITCSENKVASLPVGKQEISINSSKRTIKAGVVKKDNIYYIPLSELGLVYNIDSKYIQETDRFTVDSLDRAYVVATAQKNVSIKYKPTSISRTVAKIKKGEIVTIANRSEYPVPEGWTRVRTEQGILGYVKEKSLGELNELRGNIEDKPLIDGNVSLVWDYFSEYVTAPNRTGTTIKGVNVISPTFFRLKELGKGEILENVSSQGQSYIEWAHSQGYQIWPSLSNESRMQTTSEILNDYNLRESTINKIVNLIVKYNLDGINIDFENVYESDKDSFSRFLIELEPRLNEMGKVLSVDVTAPDGSPNWSLCYDRHTISKVADYIIFMAYDQYGVSSDKAGTTAGCGWVEENIKKFLGQEDVKPEKLILGMPFYTRLWKEKNGKLTGQPDTVAMKNVDNVLPSGSEKVWDENLQQYYVEYNKNGYTYKIWVEDEKSFSAKLDLVSKYNLAGAAYWQKDFESEGIWNVISEGLNVD